MPQTWNANDYKEKGSFVPTLGAPLLELLDIKPGMRVLDIGCGDGALTQKLLEAGATVVGIDASPSMVEAARATGIDAHVLDAHDLNFSEEFNAAFSNAALHWMTKDPGKVVQNIYNALKPNGLFVGEMGGKGNIAEIQRCQQIYLTPLGLELDKIAPKFFPDEQEYSALLESAGFTVEKIERFERPTKLPGGVADWLKVFATGTLEALPPEAIDQFLTDVEACAKPKLFKEDEGWHADYVRLRFVASKK